uniref:Uncharacterized protein n=1 Tax=Romanomermis culicivorax TaxID=13658 RepID=A0A915KZR7_ROMCU
MRMLIIHSKCTRNFSIRLAIVLPFFTYSGIWGRFLEADENFVGKNIMYHKDLEQIKDGTKISRLKEKYYTNVNGPAPNVIILEKRKGKEGKELI